MSEPTDLVKLKALIGEDPLVIPDAETVAMVARIAPRDAVIVAKLAAPDGCG